MKFAPLETETVEMGSAEPTEATDRRWIFSSGLGGLTRCAIPVIGPNAQAGVYTLRLYLAKPELDKPGGGTFDIEVQGRGRVARVCQITGRASVEEFNGIEISDNLEIRLDIDASTTARPIISGIELIRTACGE